MSNSPKAEARRGPREESRRTIEVELPGGRVIVIRLPSGKTVLRWLTGIATLATIVETIVRVVRGK